MYDELVGFCICEWSELGFVLLFKTCDCIGNELSLESLDRSLEIGWARPPPSFQDAKFAGRKIGPWFVVDIEPIKESDGDLGFLFSCVTKRGKSFKPSKFGGLSLEFPVGLFPVVTELHDVGKRGLSRSDDDCDSGGGGVDECAGKESSCCCVGCFDGVNGRVWFVGVGFPLAVHPWLVPVEIVGSNDGGIVPVSLFKLGTLAGGGIRRLLIFPRLAHPGVRARTKDEAIERKYSYVTYQLLDSFRSFVFCLQNHLL